MEQCFLFLQYKCVQYWFFICFYWYFFNQWCCRFFCRCDGIFNYSFDVYCFKYNEVIGVCFDGDECFYLYWIIGDMECKYYLCYYKMGICIYEMDVCGYCVKNGLYCVFVYGFLDLWLFVCDVRELQVQEVLQNGQLGSGEGVLDLQFGVLVSQVMIEKILSEDFWW